MSYLKKLAVVPAIFLSIMTAAQQNFPAASDTTRYMDEVVVTATKFPEKKKYVAQQIISLNSNDISNANTQSTADLLASTGNVFIQKSQLGGGSVVLRGFEANRTLLVIDGVRMNNLIYRGGHLQNIITTDQSAFDRIDVLFGPASTVYGSDALGGVVAIYTKNPVFSQGNKKASELSAFTRYGSVDNEKTVHVDWNTGDKKFASFSSVTFSDFDDLKSGRNKNPFYKQGYAKREFYVERIGNRDSLVSNTKPYLQKFSGYSQYDIVQKLSYKTSENNVHGINLQFSGSSDVPRYDRLSEPAPSLSSYSTLKYASWYYGPQTRFLSAYDFNQKNRSGYFQQAHFGLNYQHLTESRHTRKFNASSLLNRIENVQVWGANLDMNRKTEKQSLIVGIDAQYNNLKSTANQQDISTGIISGLDTRYPDGKNRMFNIAAYMSHSMQKNKRFTFNDGLRIGYSSLYSTIVDSSYFHLPYDEVNQNHIVYSANAAVILNNKNGWKQSLQLSTGFRVPNTDDLSKIFESAPGNIIVPNNNLKPEKTITVEVGIGKYADKKLSWENNIYYTRFFDAIVTEPFSFNGKDSVLYDGSMSRVLANQNLRKAFVTGFSSNLKMNPCKGLGFSLAANYTYGRIITDSINLPLDHIPPFMMKAQADYHHKKWDISFFIHYNGWKKIDDYYLNGEDNEQYAPVDGMPAWITANISVACKCSSQWSIQAGIQNIFDTQYRTFSSGIDAAGRNIFFTVKFHD